MTMHWVDVDNENVKPPVNRVLICFCPEWSETKYQVAFFNGTTFYYPEQPNDMFNDLVEQWAIFYEAD